MSKHKRRKDRERHHHGHHHRGPSVDLVKKRLYYDGETYKFDPYTEDMTPCNWWRIGKHGHRHLISMVYEAERLDGVLLRAIAMGQEAPESESSASASESAEEKRQTPWQKHMKGGPPAKGKRVERDKYGVRVYSSDGKTWWNVCVNKSTKYDGTAVRVMLPPRKDGKPPWAVFDLEAMEALRREFDRGEQPKKPRGRI
jgi:hypothetical protein